MAIRAIKNDTPSYTSGTSPNLNKRFKVREIPPGKLAEIMASLREIGISEKYINSFAKYMASVGKSVDNLTKQDVKDMLNYTQNSLIRAEILNSTEGKEERKAA